MGEYRILLVDDDVDMLRTTSAFFEKLGHQVSRAMSGEEALGLFERFEPHVTVLDYQMPGMSGLDVLERLRRKRAVVIMLTGHGEIETAVEAMRLGAENFLQKPIDMGHLQQVVEKAAEKASLQQEVVRLRARLPNPRKRTIQTIGMMILIAAAVILGLVIGQEREPELPPIPVPIEGGT